MNADETWAQIQRQERQLCDSWRKIHLRVLMFLSAGAVVVETRDLVWNCCCFSSGSRQG